jgi:vacuolar-type H+-ATPase subunit I/STV1
MSEAENCCSICLASLAKKNQHLGVCVPCGHCFHVDCFNQYLAYRRNDAHRKCPMCQSAVKGFYRVYLDLSKIGSSAGNESFSPASRKDADEYKHKCEVTERALYALQDNCNILTAKYESLVTSNRDSIYGYEREKKESKEKVVKLQKKIQELRERIDRCKRHARQNDAYNYMQLSKEQQGKIERLQSFCTTLQIEVREKTAQLQHQTETSQEENVSNKVKIQKYRSKAQELAAKLERKNHELHEMRQRLRQAKQSPR